MRKILLIVFLSGLIALTSCSDDAPTASTDDGMYAYTSYDSTGQVIVKGLIIINDEDSSNITGHWVLDKIGNPEDIGPQVGSGELIGTITNNEFWFNLNPQFSDNNLLLTGSAENNKFSGNWQWISFIGVTNQGTFEAVKI
jgi:hypothetical protein